MADPREVDQLSPQGAYVLERFKERLSGNATEKEQPEVKVAMPSRFEIPLHAQCAEALGWTNLVDRGDGLWLGKQPETGLTCEVPAYGQTWCATGPLVERFNVSVYMTGTFDWRGFARDWTKKPLQKGVEVVMCTPCEAIARVVVELHRKKEQ